MPTSARYSALKGTKRNDVQVCPKTHVTSQRSNWELKKAARFIRSFVFVGALRSTFHVLSRLFVAINPYALGASTTPRFSQLRPAGRGLRARLPSSPGRQRAGQDQHPRSHLSHRDAAL